MRRVGIRELKDRLTHYVRLVKEGHDEVLVTEHGRPVAVLHSLESVEATASSQERLAVLAKQGKVTLPRKSGPLSLARRPVRVTGTAVSRLVIDSRR